MHSLHVFVREQLRTVSTCVCLSQNHVQLACVCLSQNYVHRFLFNMNSSMCIDNQGEDMQSALFSFLSPVLVQACFAGTVFTLDPSALKA